MAFRDYQEYISSLRNIYSENKQNITAQHGITDTVGNINFTRFYHIFKGFNEKYMGNSDIIVHSHPFYEMHFFKKNPAQMVINDKTVSLAPNDALLISPDVYHHYVTPSAPLIHSTTQFYVTRSKMDIIPDYYDNFIEKLDKNGGYYVIRNAEKIISFLDILAEYSAEISDTFIMDFANPIFHLIFSELTMQICDIDDTKAHNYHTISEADFRLNTIEYYIFANYDKNPNLSDLAKIVKLSEKQVSRIIKKQYGIDFKTHILNLRLQNAKRLIKETSESLDVVSQQVGFNTYSGFYLAFKKKYGITPGDYRKAKQAQSKDRV